MKDPSSQGSPPSQEEVSPIPDELRDRLFALIADRLNTGQALISEAHFEKAMAEGYQALTSSFPS